MRSPPRHMPGAYWWERRRQRANSAIFCSPSTRETIGELENQEIAALRQYRVDGFLYAMMYHRVVEIPAELEGSPTVVVDSEDENRKIPSIYPDDEMAGYDATNRLIQAGCKRIVYYGSSITIIAQGERFAGYRRALADAGIPFDEQLVVNVEEATNAASEAGRVFDEIKPDVDNDPRAAYFDQVHNGVYIRMAIILALLGTPRPARNREKGIRKVYKLGNRAAAQSNVQQPCFCVW